MLAIPGRSAAATVLRRSGRESRSRERFTVSGAGANTAPNAGANNASSTAASAAPTSRAPASGALLLGKTRAYLQLTSGYGDSLIKYNYKQSTVVIGLSFGERW